MTIEKRLNKLLKYFKKHKRHNDDDWQKLDVGDDLKEIMHKIEGDGFVAKRDLGNGIVSYQLTIQGQVFLNKGGYVGELYYRRVSLFWKTISSIIVVIGTFLAGYYSYKQYIQNNNYLIEKAVNVRLIEILRKSVPTKTINIGEDKHKKNK